MIVYQLNTSQRIHSSISPGHIPSMPANFRPKACRACSESKRKCDKQRPECRRCIDRGVDCVYPQPKPRHRRLISQLNEYDAGQLNHGSDTSEYAASIDFLEDWGLPAADSLEMPGTRTAFPLDAAIPTVGLDISHDFTVSSNVNSLKLFEPLWFLREETWTLQSVSDAPACAAIIQLEPFVENVNEELRLWTKAGHNSFIHEQLYGKQMHPTLQLAFTMLCTYYSRTRAVEETVLRIAEERSSFLVRQQIPPQNDVRNLKTQLAQVFALFIYEFILLFNGSVRFRASAEEQLSALRQRVRHLYESAKTYKGEPHHGSIQWAASEYEAQYESVVEAWQIWALIESIRRTHLIVETTLNIYEIVRTGFAECTGAAMLTVRSGLWETSSALRWFQICCEKAPLLVPSLEPEPILAKHDATEIDGFVKMYWKYLVGEERMKAWVNTRKNERQLIE